MPVSNNGLPDMPVKTVISEIVGFIRRVTFNSRPFCVLGLSGGIDSTVVAYLLVKALGKEKVKAVIMPYHQSDKQSLEDSLSVVKALKINYSVIDISPAIDAYFARLSNVEKTRKGNKIARERMAVLYDIAAEENGLVVGTGNKSELLLGYFTKYGDGGVDILPLGALYKTQVYLLAEYLKVPERIINKPPTADLWPGQRDEDELEVEYCIADQILYRMVDIGEGIEDIIKSGFKREDVIRVAALVNDSGHKRALPPVPDIRYMSLT